MQDALFSGLDVSNSSESKSAGAETTDVKTVEQARAGRPRMRLADRTQVGMHLCSIDELVTLDHQVRVVWDAVCQMNLAGFEESIRAREFTEGRPANDVRVMVGLWLWAASNGISGGRKVARLCERDLTFIWMCGGLEMNYHTLNDFKVGHQAALDALFTATLGRLMHAGLVTVTRIAHDGLRVRASAGAGSFRRRQTLEQCLVQAQTHLAELKKQADLLNDSDKDQDDDDQPRSPEEAIATDRLARVKQALAELTKVEAAKKKQSNKDKREKPSRASTTDPEARVMKMPNGGFNPAFNVQLASDPGSRAIVGVMVSNSGGDAPLLEPMRQDVETRTGEKVSEHLIDGGYVNLDSINCADEQNVTLYMPVPRPNSKQVDRYARRDSDSDSVANWRTRMNSEQGRTIYKQRASTIETVNADLRSFRGMNPFTVRGISKVTCVALWSALAYNLMHFSAALT